MVCAYLRHDRCTTRANWDYASVLAETKHVVWRIGRYVTRYQTRPPGVPNWTRPAERAWDLGTQSMCCACTFQKSNWVSCLNGTVVLYASLFVVFAHLSDLCITHLFRIANSAPATPPPNIDAPPPRTHSMWSQPFTEVEKGERKVKRMRRFPTWGRVFTAPTPIPPLISHNTLQYPCMLLFKNRLRALPSIDKFVGGE